MRIRIQFAVANKFAMYMPFNTLTIREDLVISKYLCHACRIENHHSLYDMQQIQ